MRAFHLPGCSKPSTSETTPGTRDFTLVRMRFCLVAWIVMGLFGIFIVAPRLLGIT